MDSLILAPAQPADLPAVLALLSTNQLPPDGLADHFDAAVVARDGTRIVGSAALERYGDVALLRSVAVDASYQGQGLGGHLVDAILAMADQHSIRHVYLLTTTAEAYFPRFGFRRIMRSEVNPALHQSAEFQGACPDSAVVMVYGGPGR